MNLVVPWAELVALIEPHAPSNKTGRPPFAVATMLRIHFLPQWFGLSDPAMEEALHDIPMFCEFAHLDLGMCRLPDKSMILRFRHLLEDNNLRMQILATTNATLATKGLMLKTGTDVDATLIAAPSFTKNNTGERHNTQSCLECRRARQASERGQRSANCAVPPARIVPMLADEGVYLACESTFARVLRTHGQTAHRERANAPKARRPPTTHIATAARQVWCWDTTYLPATVIGRWFHLYLILDLYSRKLVGWEMHADDSSDHAVHLVRRTALAKGIAALTDKPVLHGYNGSTLKATTVLAMLNWLGVKPSYSRPRVSDDNACAESLFRTAKHRQQFPAKGFETLEAARQWGAAFVHWYNLEHKHSGIRYVSPQQRDTGEDHAILAARHTLYTQARGRHPARWARHTRDWSPMGPVTLNPERDSVIDEHVEEKLIQSLAA